MKSKFQSFLLLIVTTLFFAACTTPPAEKTAVDMDKLKVEIQAMEDAFSAGEKAKDAAAVVAYYADDAVSHVRNMEPVSGKAAIQERIAKNIANDTLGTTNVYKVVDLYADGDLAVEIGSWTETLASGAAGDKGHYMSVFQKRDGKYVCIRDMSVSSTPAKPAEKPAQ